MAKYRKKSPLVDAVPYHLGLEDGWMPPYLTYDQGGLLHEVPYIDTKEGRFPIGQGDWIVTDREGNRRVVKAHLFHELYELAEDDAAA